MAFFIFGKNNTMETTDNAFETAMNPPARPQFLTIICILSFIMCGLGVISAVYGVVKSSPESIQQSAEDMRKWNPQMADKFEENMMEMQETTYGQISPYLAFVYVILSFLGVIMMWKLNKKGFFIYVAGEILPYLGFIVAGKQSMNMMASMGGGAAQSIGIVVTVLMLLFDIAFIIMYWVNLKHLK